MTRKELSDRLDKYFADAASSTSELGGEVLTPDWKPPGARFDLEGWEPGRARVGMLVVA